MPDMKTNVPGDWIVHCHHGVGQIEGVERKRFSDQENTYYRIRTIDSTIWIPVDQMGSEQIRPVADESDFQEAVKVLNSLPREMSANLNTRKSRIKQVIVDNMPTETARLIRDLRARRHTKGGLNQSERQALRDLTKRFVQEWSVCKGMTIEQARQRLNKNFSKRRTGTLSHARTIQKDRERSEESSLLYTLINQDDRWAEWLAQQLAEGM